MDGSRDVAPGNVLSGSDGAVRLCDFGVAACLETPRDRRRTICGTPGYVAPEVLSGKQYDARCADVWSFGLLCFGMMFGRFLYSTLDSQPFYRYAAHQRTLAPSLAVREVWYSLPPITGWVPC